jgi:DNA-binding response OmpR family regulator
MASVLIIDDNEQIAAPLAALLRSEGHAATYAPGAGAALSHLRQSPPDLVLLDLSMPRVDGLDLLDALRSEPCYAGVRVAILSGRDDAESMAEARRLGACEYIVKGSNWDDVYSRIKANLPGGSNADA